MVKKLNFRSSSLLCFVYCVTLVVPNMMSAQGFGVDVNNVLIEDLNCEESASSTPDGDFSFYNCDTSSFPSPLDFMSGYSVHAHKETGKVCGIGAYTMISFPNYERLRASLVATYGDPESIDINDYNQVGISYDAVPRNWAGSISAKWRGENLVILFYSNDVDISLMTLTYAPLDEICESLYQPGRPALIEGL